MRRPFQGVGNILRFNWHFFVAVAVVVVALLAAGAGLQGPLRTFARGAAGALGATTLVSLLVSCYVYDLSGLYHLAWLRGVVGRRGSRPKMANIHAGFDETTAALRGRYPEAVWTVMDFYDPARHTEISIRRARRAWPPSPEDLRVDSSSLPAAAGSFDAVFVLLAAHEIRDAGERAAFFAELRRVLAPGGRVVVLEHLRDAWNLLAYTVGAFHFHRRGAWLEAFRQARLRLVETRKPNPFLTCFVLENSGDPS